MQVSSLGKSNPQSCLSIFLQVNVHFRIGKDPVSLVIFGSQSISNSPHPLSDSSHYIEKFNASFPTKTLPGNSDIKVGC